MASEDSGISQKELLAQGYSIGTGTPKPVIAKDGINQVALNHMAASSQIEYQPAPEKNGVLDHLAGIVKPTGQLWGLYGSTLHAFGDLIHNDNNPEKQTMADEMMRQGLVIKENNDKWAKENFPDSHGNVLEDAYQQSPTLATMVGISHVVPGPLAKAGLAVAMGTAPTIESYNEFRNRGDTKPEAIAKAAAIGLATSLPALWTFNAFESEKGSVIQQTLKNAATAAMGGAAQSVAAGSMELFTGLKEYKGAESFTDLIGQGIHDAAVWAILGGAHGAQAAITNKIAVRNEFIKQGMGPKTAEAKTNELLSLGTNEVMNWVKDQAGMTRDQQSRILIKRPDVVAKILQVEQKMNRGEALDPLDYNFIPGESRPVDSGDMKSQLSDLESKKAEISDLQKVITGNSEHQEVNRQIVEQGKQAESEVNVKHDEILKQAQEEAVGKQAVIEKDTQAKMAAWEKKNTELTSKLSDVQADQAKLQKYAEERTAELQREGKTNHPDMEKLAKTAQTLSDKEDRLHEKIDAHDQKKLDIGRDREMGLAQLEREHTQKITQLEKNRNAELQDRLQNVPILHKAKDMLEQLQNEAKTMKDKIDQRKEELKPQGSKITQLKREINILERGARKGKQSALADAKEVQAKLSKMIRDKETGLTQAKDFKKFDTLIRKTITPEKLNEAIPQIKRMVRQLNERAEQLKWRDDLKKIKLDKLPVGYQDALKPLLDGIDLHFRSGKDIKVKQQTLDFFKRTLEAGNQNGQLTFGEQQALDAAGKKSITEMGHDGFSALYQAITSTITEGKRINELVAQKGERDFKIVRDRGVQRMLAMTGGKPVLIESNTAKIDARKQNRNFLEKVWDGQKWWGKAQILDEELIRRVGAPEMFQALHEGHQQMREDNIQDEKVISKFFKALNIPETLTKGIDKEFKDAKDGTDTFKGKDALTLNAYMKIYAQSQNENGLRHLIGDAEKGTEGSGFSKETIMDIQDWIEKDHPEAAKAIQDMFDYFAPGSTAFNRLEAAVIKDKGHRIAVEDNYDPIQRLVNVPSADFEWGVTGAYGRGVMNSGFIDPRVKSSLAFKDFDYLGDIFRHIHDTNAYINLNGALRDLQKYIDDPQVRKVAQAVHGDQMIPALQKYINDLAFNGHQMDGAASQMYSKFRQRFTFAQIGFNILSALKEVSQFAPSATEVGWGWQSKALVQRAYDMKGTDAFIDSKSLMMKNQGIGGEQVFSEMALRGANSLGPPGTEQKVRQVGLWMHQEVYRSVSRATWLGAYQRFMAKARSMDIDLKEADTSAVQYADQLTRATHPVQGDIYTPGAFRQGDIGRTLGMFHSAITRNYNLFANDIQQVKEGNMSPLEAATKGLSRTLFTALIIGTISQRRALQKDELPAYMLDVSLGSDVLYGMFTRAYIDGKFRGLENPAAQSLGAVYGTFDSRTTSEQRKSDIAEASSDFTGIPFGVLYQEISGHSFTPKKDR